MKKSTSFRTGTSVIIDVMRKRVHDILQAFLHDGVWHALPQRKLENLQVGGEGILVHAVDGRHLREHEKQDGATLGRRTIAVTELVNVNGRLSS